MPRPMGEWQLEFAVLPTVGYTSALELPHESAMGVVMTVANGFRPAVIQSVDELFANLNGRTRSGQLLPTRPEEIGRPSAPVPRRPDSDFEAPPMPIGDDVDVQAQRTWIEEERRRLEAYTLNQLALIERRREEILSQQSQVQQALVLREQELHRQLNLLAARAEALQKREQELAERETKLSNQSQESAIAAEEAKRLQAVSRQFQQETETQRQQLDAMRNEADRLQEVIRSAQTQGDDWERTLIDRRREWEEENAKLTERRKQLEVRIQSIDRAEEAIRRRTAELDELEARLQEELEARELDLVRHAAEMEQRRASIRKAEESLQRRAGEIEEMKARLEQEIAARPAVAEQQNAAQEAEWAERRKALEQADAGLQRRAKELEEMHLRLDQEGRDREEEKKLLAARRAQLERRQAAVERSEQALQRRQKELDELELQLRHEYERREQRLAAHKQEVENLWKQLRLRSDPPALSDPSLANAGSTSLPPVHRQRSELG